MKKLAIITCLEFPELDAADQALPQKLAQRDIIAEAVPWNDTSVNWADYSSLLFRSCWDYFKYSDKFVAWLSQRKKQGLQAMNSYESVLWNYDKKYLLALEQKGITIAPLFIFSQQSSVDLAAFEAQHACDEYVLKPAISGGAWKTQRTASLLTDDTKRLCDDILSAADLIIQPLFPEILEEGEYSLIFIGSEFSHAVLKTPLSGDYRSQAQFNSNIKQVIPSEDLIHQAKQVINATGLDLCYARVDGFLRDGQLQLMELELIEPCLFFDFAPSSAMDKLCDQVSQRNT